METIKTGVETSEYKETQSAKVWGIVSTVIGLLITIGSSVAASLGADTKYAIVVGAVITGLGVFQKTIMQLGYVKGRSDVKASGLGGLNSNK